MAELEVKYFDPRRPGSYAGLDKFYRSGPGASRKRLKQWLKGEESYTLHKPVRYTFKRNRVVVSGIDSQWDVDLIDMIQYKKSNDDYKHILVATDILSHYAWTRALKSKTGREVTSHCQIFLQEEEYLPLSEAIKVNLKILQYNHYSNLYTYTIS